jgi:hypothetical protein
MSKDISINLKDIPGMLGRVGHKLARIAPLGFLLLVAALYGFLLLRIMTLSNAQPDSTDVSGEISKLTPHIDEKAASQLQGLKDNSVNVRTLFNDARNNPFGE